ncbi:MAG: acyltransferase [Prevotellaceae bacterium]|nr:acyltransferase [Prevotellaceae bacterium]
MDGIANDIARHSLGATQSKGQRIEYIDCMRGFTMILVVYHHVVYYFLSNGAEEVTNFDSIIMSFRMPLFFFISGLMACRLHVDSGWLREKCRRRLLEQFMPTVVVGVLYVLFIHHDLRNLLFDSAREGYWFTITLFEVFVCYAVVSYVLDRLKLNTLAKDLFFVGIMFLMCLCFVLSLTSRPFATSAFSQIFGLYQFVKFLPLFLLGVLAKMYFPRFSAIAGNNIVASLALLLFVVLCVLRQVRPDMPFVGATQSLQAILGIVMVYKVFYSYRDFFSANTKVGRCLSHVGKHTLPIYLLHFFFVSGLMGLKNTNLPALISDSWSFELFFVFLCSLLIVGATLLVDKFLGAFPLLHSIMLGWKTRKGST